MSVWLNRSQTFIVACVFQLILITISLNKVAAIFWDFAIIKMCVSEFYTSAQITIKFLLAQYNDSAAWGYIAHSFYRGRHM